MRSLDHLDRWLFASGDDGAMYRIKRFGVMFTAIASWGMGWEHVSVSTQHRCPTWEEMNWIKDQFFDSDEAVMQLHPPKHNYINNHPHCLHLWKPVDVEIPQPPLEMVGIKS